MLFLLLVFGIRMQATCISLSISNALLCLIDLYVVPTDFVHFSAAFTVLSDSFKLSLSVVSCFHGLRGETMLTHMLLNLGLSDVCWELDLYLFYTCNEYCCTTEGLVEICEQLRSKHNRYTFALSSTYLLAWYTIWKLIHSEHSHN